jgi:Glyoxalase superfamily protein
MSFAAYHAIPILRIFDRAKAHEFYLDYLGFTCHASRSWQGLILIELGSAHVRLGSGY